MYLILIQKEVKFKKQQKQQKIKLQIKLHGLSYEVLQVNQNLRQKHHKIKNLRGDNYKFQKKNEKTKYL